MDKKTFSSLREARKNKTKLPPHLAKFFDKDGNLKDKKMAAKIRKDRAMRGVKITDVTPDWMFEVSPPGWEGTVKAMKKKKEIDNPWRLAWWMHNKGMKPHIPEELGPLQLATLSEGVTGPTRMEIQKFFDNANGTLRQRLSKTEKAFDIKKLIVNAKGTVVGYRIEDVDVDEHKLSLIHI